MNANGGADRGNQRARSYQNRSLGPTCAQMPGVPGALSGLGAARRAGTQKARPKAWPRGGSAERGVLPCLAAQCRSAARLVQRARSSSGGRVRQAGCRARRRCDGRQMPGLRRGRLGMAQARLRGHRIDGGGGNGQRHVHRVDQAARWAVADAQLARLLPAREVAAPQGRVGRDLRQRGEARAGCAVSVGPAARGSSAWSSDASRCVRWRIRMNSAVTSTAPAITGASARCAEPGARSSATDAARSGPRPRRPRPGA